MPLTKSTTISKGVRVGKFVGVGFLNVVTARGEVKMYSGDHIIEVDYTRATRPGDIPGVNGVKELNFKEVTAKKTAVFVVSEDAAKALGIFLNESVEEENIRVAKELEEKRAADDEARAAKAAADLAKTPTA